MGNWKGEKFKEGKGVPGRREPHPVLGDLIIGRLPGGIYKVGSEGSMHRKHLEAH